MLSYPHALQGLTGSIWANSISDFNDVCYRGYIAEDVSRIRSLQS
jgi:hypothetical protein